MSAIDTVVEDLVQALASAGPHTSILVMGTPEMLDSHCDSLRRVRSVHDVDDAQFVSLFRSDLADGVMATMSL